MSKLKFRDMDELKEYLEKLELRVEELEDYTDIPDTNIVSNNFLKRAFAIWGHYFVANLIIGAIVGAAVTLMYVILGTALLTTIISNTRSTFQRSTNDGYYPCEKIPGALCKTPEP